MKTALLVLIGCAISIASHGVCAADALPVDAHVVVDVWPGVAPGSEKWTRKETITQFVFAGRAVPVTRNVVKPTLTVYLPDAKVATGAAAVISPGGAFRHVTMDSEGYDVARWLAKRGIAGIVLKYRVVETPADDVGYKKSMDDLTSRLGKEGMPRPSLDEDAKFAIADGVQALKVVRAHAVEWRIDPERIGMIGFSAGAGLTVGVMLQPNPPMLAFAAPIYGARFGAQVSLPDKLPPIFLAVAQDDLLVREAVLNFNSLLQTSKHDSEVHIYSSGGHGFGMIPQGTTSDHWIDELHWWLQAKGIVGKSH